MEKKLFKKIEIMFDLIYLVKRKVNEKAKVIFL